MSLIQLEKPYKNIPLLYVLPTSLPSTEPSCGESKSRFIIDWIDDLNQFSEFLFFIRDTKRRTPCPDIAHYLQWRINKCCRTSL